MNPTKNNPTLGDAASLPPALGLRAAAAWLGISPTTAYRLIDTGRFPVPVHRVGTSLRVPTATLLTYLGITTAPATDTETTTPDTADADTAGARGAGSADATDTAQPATGRTRAAGEPPRRGLHPVGRPSVDGPRAG